MRVCIALLMCAAAGWGCSEDAGLAAEADVGAEADAEADAEAETAPESDAEADSEPGPDAEPDTEPPVVWTPLPAGCVAPSDLAADPLWISAQVKPPGGNGPVHLLDIVADRDAGWIYTSGTSGFYLVSIDDDGSLALQGRFPPQGNAQFEHLRPLGGNRVALSHLSGPATHPPGVVLVNVANPISPSLIGNVPIPDVAGLEKHPSEELLYVLTHTGQLWTLDLTTPKNPAVLDQLDGLGNPWQLVIAPDGSRAWAADASKGVAVIDLSAPQAPTLTTTVPTEGGAQDVALDLDRSALWVAVGSAGVEVFDLTDPAQPASIGLVDIGGPAVSVSVADGLVWATDQAGVALIDGADPAAPRLLGTEATPSWAMNVDASGEQAFVADWNAVRVVSATPESLAPELDTNRDAIYVAGEAPSEPLVVTNRGAADLEIVGASVDDARFSVTSALVPLVIAPGESAELRIEAAGIDGPVDATLCLASNAPQTPTLELPIASSSSGSSVLIGELAPDFVLPDTKGALHTLSEQRGHPVVLAYFATW